MSDKADRAAKARWERELRRMRIRNKLARETDPHADQVVMAYEARRHTDRVEWRGQMPFPGAMIERMYGGAR